VPIFSIVHIWTWKRLDWNSVRYAMALAILMFCLSCQDLTMDRRNHQCWSAWLTNALFAMRRIQWIFNCWFCQMRNNNAHEGHFGRGTSLHGKSSWWNREVRDIHNNDMNTFRKRYIDHQRSFSDCGLRLLNGFKSPGILGSQSYLTNLFNHYPSVDLVVYVETSNIALSIGL